jgi:predicted GIY-YIG superfamily endonuclease
MIVYRYFCKDEGLLYVGITTDMSRRAAQHAKNAEWWSLVARVSVQEFDDEKSAREHERKAIALEFPRFNKLGNRLSTEYITTAVHLRVDQWEILRRAAAEQVKGTRSKPSVSALLREIIDDFISKAKKY